MSSATVNAEQQVGQTSGAAGSGLGAGRGLAILMIVTGIIGWIAAFSLTLERINVAENPDAVLSCDVSPFISCKSVMLTAQAKLFGFPNPLIGLAAFAVPVVVGMAILAGAKFSAWFWRLYTVGLGLGFTFVIWLFSQSAFVINVLCPYCMVAWAAMIPLFWAVFLYGTAEGFVPVPVKTVPFFVAAYDYAWVFTVLTFLGLSLTILIRFWDFWPGLF